MLLILPQVTEAQTYDFKNYTVDDGLAQSQVLSICQDSAGYMWFGTNNGGVSKYDGHKFITYTNKDGLVNNVVYSIIQDRKGDMLFGTNGGLSILDGNHFINYSETDSLRHVPNNRIFKVYQDHKGTIWLGTWKGVYILKGKKIIPFDAIPDLNNARVFTIFADDKNNMWFGTITKGLYKYDGNSFINYTENDGLSSNFVRTICQDSKGIIWVGTIKGFHRIINGKITNEEAKSGFLQLTITSSLLDNKGNIWLGSESGAIKYNGNRYKRYLESNGLISDKIYSVFQDREGNYWFGSEDKGISEFSNREFINYSSKDGLADDAVYAVYQDKLGHYWIGCRQVGLSEFDGSDTSVFHTYSKEIINSDKQLRQTINANISYGLAFQNTYCIFQDKAGNLWFGTRGGGISKYVNGKFTTYSKKDGLSSDKVYCINEDQKGTLWLGTAKGVTLINGEGSDISILDKDKALQNTSVNYILFDHKSNVWLATDIGLVKYDGQSIRFFRKKDGFVNDRVRNIVEDKQGNLWLGTNYGLFRYDGKSFELIDVSKGLISNTIYQLLIDNQGYLWVGTNKGLDKIDIDLFNKNKKISITYYGKSEGFMGLECNENAAFKDKQGKLWFGTVKGVTVYNPALDKKNKKAPQTHITGLSMFFQNNFDWKKYADSIDARTGLPIHLVLPYNENHITFKFVGVSMTNAEKVKYQFKLDGLDHDWYPPTNKSEATYSNIPPGEYTFLVKAANNDGVWNKEPVSFHFEILPPWYHTWWFYISVGIISLVIIYLFIVLRTRQLEKTKRRLEAEVQVRTHELREEKEKVEQINQEVLQQKSLIETKNRDITDSINYAKRIQEALLPTLNDIYNDFNDAFVFYRPKDIVSGDFYWYAKRNDKMYIAAVDCTGHGVPGAFMSMIGNNLINQIVLENKVEHPGEILMELNNRIKDAFKRSHKDIDTNDGMDVAFCAVDLKKGTLEYSGAQRPLYLVHGDKLTEIKGTKRPIGGITEPGYVFENHVIPVEQGLCGYICSDGYADQFGGAKGKKFLSKRLKDTLLEMHQLPMTEQKNKLVSSLDNWIGEYEQVDDILVIGFKL